MMPKSKFDKTSRAETWVLASWPAAPTVPLTAGNHKYGATSTCQPSSAGSRASVLVETEALDVDCALAPETKAIATMENPKNILGTKFARRPIAEPLSLNLARLERLIELSLMTGIRWV